MNKKVKEGEPVTISYGDALKVGIIKCSHCGWPPNNHFDFAPRTCAHDKRCSGFTPMISIPLGIDERDF